MFLRKSQTPCLQNIQVWAYKTCLPDLYWLPVSHRTEQKIATVCCNVILGSAPLYLADLLQLYTPGHILITWALTVTLTLKTAKQSFTRHSGIWWCITTISLAKNGYIAQEIPGQTFNQFFLLQDTASWWFTAVQLRRYLLDKAWTDGQTDTAIPVYHR